MARRLKNQDLPGTQREQFKDVDVAIDEYVDKRDTWQDNSKAVTKAKEKLAELMNAHGLVKYRKDDLVAEVKHKSKDDVKVRAVDTDELGED